MTKGLPRSLSRGNPQRETVIRQQIALRDQAITINGLTGVGWGTLEVSDMPEGNVLILGASATLRLTAPGSGVIATWDGNFALGSAPITSGVIAGQGGDIVPSTVVPAATALISPIVRGVSTPVQAGNVLNNTDGSLEWNLNVLVSDASISANGCVFLVAGDINLAYMMLGDS